MGIVVSARDILLGSPRSRQFDESAAAPDRTAKGSFLRETRTSLALSNQHVAKVLDVGTKERGELFMVMEYLTGRDLPDVLHQNGPLPVPDAVGAELQACEAIAEAHAVGIVRRELRAHESHSGDSTRSIRSPPELGRTELEQETSLGNLAAQA